MLTLRLSLSLLGSVIGVGAPPAENVLLLAGGADGGLLLAGGSSGFLLLAGG